MVWEGKERGKKHIMQCCLTQLISITRWHMVFCKFQGHASEFLQRQLHGKPAALTLVPTFIRTKHSRTLERAGSSGRGNTTVEKEGAETWKYTQCGHAAQQVVFSFLFEFCS